MRGLDRRLSAIEAKVPTTTTATPPSVRAYLDRLTTDQLRRLERFAETWPPELGKIPMEVVEAVVSHQDGGLEG